MSSISPFFRPPAPARRGYFHLLDLARGLAACSILVWHYQHFIALGLAPAGSRGAYPFFSILRPFYEYGSIAVQLFWIISGFVFSEVYAGAETTGREFFVNRLARLYPLHFLTLVVVAALQLGNVHASGHPLIYADNDAPHFVLHLFMASGWPDPVSFSFNAPIWSVSAEILVYGMFWIALPRLFRWGMAGPLIAAAACGVLARTAILPTIWLCGFYFLVGCAIFAFHRASQDRPFARIVIAVAIGASAPFGWRIAGQFVGALLLFSAAILFLTAIERFSSHRLVKQLGWLGDSTYGIYLWHVPIQLAMLLALHVAGRSRAIAFSPAFFATYVITVVLVARLSFLYFERPMRGYIRRRFADR